METLQKIRVLEKALKAEGNLRPLTIVRQGPGGKPLTPRRPYNKAAFIE